MKIYRLSVTLSGFKPETFSSVVRCSIQLSYKAKPFWECKDIKQGVFLQIIFELHVKVYKKEVHS